MDNDRVMLRSALHCLRRGIRMTSLYQASIVGRTTPWPAMMSSGRATVLEPIRTQCEATTIKRDATRAQNKTN